MITLLDIKNSSRVQRISGLSSSSQDFLGYVNDAVRMLVNRGDFYGTVKNIRACVYSGCIVWPRQVATVLAINRCNNSVSLHNHWAEFDRLTRHDLLSYWGANCCGQVQGLQGDRTCVFNPISCADGKNGVYIRFYPTQPTDVGKIVTVFGIDSNGEELRSLHLDGTTQDGIETTLLLPFATMPASDRNVNTMRHITRIIKPVTDGPLYCYQFRAIDNVMLNLARYESSETNPDYETTRLGGDYMTACGALPRQITALVKLRHINLVNDDDMVIIDNLDAIAMMLQTLKLGDSYDVNQKKAMEAEAVREMNLELRRQLPLDEIPVTISPFGTALPSRHGVGRFV